MTIKRKINDVEVEIKLTDSEMLDIFYKMQHRFDVADVREYIELNFENDASFYEEYGFQRASALKLVDEMAYRMRKNINTYDDGWPYYRDDAISQIINEHANEEES